jgi:hypothetical protein
MLVGSDIAGDMSATRTVSALEISLAASGVRFVAVRRSAARRLYVSDVHSPNLRWWIKLAS